MQPCFLHNYAENVIKYTKIQKLHLTISQECDKIMVNHTKGEASAMFKYIELENYKSFGKIRFDFSKNKQSNEIKKFIAVYGENGSGKSNFVSGIELLCRLITSFSRKNQFKEPNSENEKKEYVSELLKQVISGRVAMPYKIDLSKHRMLGEKNATRIKYGFVIDGIEGYYTVAFNDTHIVEEELYYLTGKQRGVLFSINAGQENADMKFSRYLFLNSGFKKFMSEQLKMYWGKYTLLSLIYKEMREKNSQYINDCISENILKVINGLTHISVICKPSQYSNTSTVYGSNIPIRDLSRVHLDIHNEQQTVFLKKIEAIINDFYVQTYSDIESVFYEQNTSYDAEEDIAEYVLYVKKIIAGKSRRIPFSIESAGTQNVLSVLRAVIDAINGNTVVYDEIDNGIHDLLMKNILASLQNDITGQLIITTHNTLLLENLSPKSAYVIYSDYDGNKEARCLDDYDMRIQPSNNQRRLYLSGAFGGIPYASSIDYSNMHIKEAD